MPFAEAVGEKLAVTPAGRPDMLNDADPLKPPVPVIVSASLADWPGFNVIWLAAALKLNAACAVTLKLRFVETIVELDVPVIVSG